MNLYDCVCVLDCIPMGLGLTTFEYTHEYVYVHQVIRKYRVLSLSMFGWNIIVVAVDFFRRGGWPIGTRVA